MAMPPPEERPTMQQLAAQAGGNAPWTCPNCGCRDWRVHKTREAADGSITRVRCCRHCGKDGPRLFTAEQPYRVVHPEEGERDCA